MVGAWPSSTRSAPRRGAFCVTPRAYWSAGVHLDEAKLKEGHAQRLLRVRFLLYHSIELYLKTFLRVQGLNVKQLYQLGHEHRRLGKRAVSRGLELMDEDLDLLRLIDQTDAYLRSKYIETGFVSSPSIKALRSLCDRLDDMVARAFYEEGL